jgi:two-component system KDP operon response regulator KdpE
MNYAFKPSLSRAEPGFRPRILLVDGDPQLQRSLGPALSAAGYEPVPVVRGGDALSEMARMPPDAAVIELQLPDMDGRDFLATARGFYDGPILILSTQTRAVEKIEALDLGADDYVEKPFNLGELLARLRVGLRHGIRRERVEPVVRVGDLQIDIARRLVTRAGKPVGLSPNEYQLLKTLVAGYGRVVTHAQLLMAALGPAHADNVQYLRVAIGHLRRKLESDPANPILIRTVPHVGYRFVADLDVGA